MILGPVFGAELLRTARRRRYYVLRVLYGLMLLSIVWLGYESTFRNRSTVMLDQMAEFAEATFLSFSVVQLIAILLLIPAIFGGAIADEKQRKTLHFLMASQLSSFEIVVDKILGRAPHLLVFFGFGLPVVCSLGLFGGIPPEYVAIAYVGSASTATMAVALVVLVSTMARKVRQAVLISYVLMLAWQFVPMILYAAGSSLYPQTYAWIEPVNKWVAATSPLSVYVTVMMRVGPSVGNASTPLLLEAFEWMVGLQLASASLMILVAVWRLRPTFRRHEATQPRRKWFALKERTGRRRRWWTRPPCGDDAVLWKERYFARSDLFTKLVILPATIFVSTILILVSGMDESLPQAISGVWHGRFGHWAEILVDQLRMVSVWYVAIWLLAVAGASASCLSIEREEDTWVSLTSTPLSGWEIVRGKILGAAWAQRGFLAIPLGFWTLGLITGTLHPLGFLGALVVLALMTWMVASVGVNASLRASSTSKALAKTIGILAVVYGYPLFFLWAFTGNRFHEGYLPFVGFPPRLVVGPLASYHYVSECWKMMTEGSAAIIPPFGEMIFGLLATFLAGCLAMCMTYRVVGQFDQCLDRPRLSSGPGLAPTSKPVAKPTHPLLQP